MTEGLDLGGMLAKISENPEASAMLRELLGGAGASAESNTEEEVRSDAPAGEAGASPSPTPRKSYAKRCELLHCLRPYLGPRRCATLDRVLRALELYEILEKTSLMKGERHV